MAHDVRPIPNRLLSARAIKFGGKFGGNSWQKILAKLIGVQP